ncbi:unnamed protein product [Cylicostephanus goldi]|uniref:Uncharacterized protein n=1 Tax=Cylicostephanus goldi TaxID=71465 RepID=A0A3P7NSJ7_CYLGO|nr:unnamed protein product [Cylicostephanus goldi]
MGPLEWLQRYPQSICLKQMEYLVLLINLTQELEHPSSSNLSMAVS